mgnify:CR=1 FL=1|jgi:hypothetical protein
MNTLQLLKTSDEDINKMTKADIIKALISNKYSVTSAIDQKESDAERHNKEMKEFRTIIEALASCLNVDLPRCTYNKTVHWNQISVPLLMGKMFAQIAGINYDKELVKEQ